MHINGRYARLRPTLLEEEEGKNAELRLSRVFIGVEQGKLKQSKISKLMTYATSNPLELKGVGRRESRPTA